MTPVDLANVVNATDVFVRDLARDAHFAVKSRERSDIRQHVFRKKFECDWLSKFQIIGAIDLAHTAFAEQPDDPIAIGENGPRNESRVIN
jgi:hypothetical protein